MELHHPLLQLASLIRRKPEVTGIVGAVVVQVIVAKLSLNSVGAKKGVSDEWAWQSTWQHVVSQLQTKVVSVKTDRR